jgi:hypothetical protein
MIRKRLTGWIDPARRHSAAETGLASFQTWAGLNALAKKAVIVAAPIEHERTIA